MTDEQRALLDRATKSLQAARILLRECMPGFAASRAYYAMFYVAEAMLDTEGLAFSKHSAVIASFGQRFVRVNRVEAKFHRYLIEAHELRQAGDYGDLDAVNAEDARNLINRAAELIELGGRFLA